LQDAKAAAAAAKEVVRAIERQVCISWVLFQGIF
jgi:hypothetical protein